MLKRVFNEKASSSSKDDINHINKSYWKNSMVNLFALYNLMSTAGSSYLVDKARQERGRYG